MERKCRFYAYALSSIRFFCINSRFCFQKFISYKEISIENPLYSSTKTILHIQEISMKKYSTHLYLIHNPYRCSVGHKKTL